MSYRILFYFLFLAAFLSPLANADDSVGTISGSFSVEDDGSASYIIPVELPPAIGGMMPEVSIAYNSNNGNGALGVGWRLNAYRSISRCPTNLEIDGFIDGVDFDDNDQLCLDGSRLIYDDTTMTYYLGNDYSTKVQKFTAASGRYYFRVTSSNGVASYYGIKNDAYNQVDGVLTDVNAMHFNVYGTEVVEWKIGSSVDLFGNVISYEYEGDSTQGIHRIKSISYDDRLVVFDWDKSGDYERADKVYAYIAPRTLLKINYSLRDISIYSHDKLFVTHSLSYMKKHNKQLLKSILKCSFASEFACLEMTKFVWQEPASSEFLGFKDTAGSNSKDHANFYFDDFDGDGRSDYMYHNPYGNDGDMRLRISLGDGYFSGSTYSSGSETEEAKFYPADFDGDGYSDYVYHNKEATGEIKVKINKRDRSFSAFNNTQGSKSDYFKLYFYDFDGDRRSDYLAWNRYFSQDGDLKLKFSKGNGFFGAQYRPSGSSSKHSKFYFGDFNGDGITDYAMQNRFSQNGDVRIKLSKGDGNFTAFTRSSGSESKYTKFYFYDFNGDGYTDYAMHNPRSIDGKIKFKINRGDATFESVREISGSTSDDTKFYFGDFDGDGFIDIACHNYKASNSSLRIKFNDGDGTFQSYRDFSGSNDGWTSFYVSDLNGDGASDYVYHNPNSNTGNLRVKLSRANVRNLVIREIHSGISLPTKISYGFLSDGGDLYTKDSDAKYPVRDIQGAVRVVKFYHSPNSANGYNKTTYKYEGLKTHLRGVGSLGFRKIEIRNDSTGTISIKTFSQDWQQRTQGWIQSTQTIASNGTILAESYNQLDNKFRKEDGSRIDDALYDAELPYIKATTSIQRDLDGSVINLTTLHHELNEKGWVESDRTCVTGLPAISSPIDSGIQYCDLMSNKDIDKTTTYEYYDESFAPDFAPLLQVKTTQVTIPDAPPFQPATESRVIAYTYVEETGKLESETVQPNVHPVTNDTFPWSDVWLTKTYDYRSTGQLESTTVTGADIASRSSRVEFDTQNRPWKKFNALNHMEEVLYENASFPWLPTKIISPNGLAVEYQYNSWGRKIKTISADGNWTATDKRWCDNDTQCLYSDEEFYVESSSSIGPNNYVYFDKLGREVRREGVGLHNGVAKPIFQRTYYNDQGLVEFSGQPYYSGDQEYKSETTYDELGRPVTIKDAAGYESTIQYGGRTVIYTNPKMHKKTVVKNALGQQVEVKDTNNKSITYRYDAFGNLVYLEDPSSNQTKIGFNSRGFKVKLDDPDQGSWTYDYNVLGQLTDQTDANNNVVHTEYDLIGRKTLRTDFYGSANAETSNWYYDEATVDNSIGKLTRVTNNHNFEQKLFYNDLYGRPTSTETRVNGEVEPYVTSTNYYEDTGRLKDITYPNGYTVRNIYHPALGSLDSVVSQSSNYVFWKAKHTNAKGQLEQSTLGGFIDVTKFHNDQTGMVESIHASHLGTVYQDLAYQWDSVGNLDYFDDHLQGVYEDYVYDDLDRLTTVIGSNSTQSISYDELGNIRSKTGTGSYNYNEIAVPSECGADDHAAGPHAVRRITGDKANYFCYDKNGNLVKDKDGRNLKYTAFNKPYEISKGTTAVKFQYAPSRSRFLREDNKNGAITTTYYLGGYEKVVEADNTVKHKVMVAGVAQVVEEVAGSSTTKSINFLLKDQLGSITSIIKAEVVNDMVQGAIVENMSYDAWGNRRLTNLDLLADPDSYKNEWTDRGFTGHEHIDSVGLIHMNGRVYDPIISRFVSPDPIVQAPSNIQSLNRYSYVMNNPLSMVDPSGYSWISKKWKQIRRLGFMGEAVPILYGVTGSAYSAAMGFYNGNKAHNNGASTRQSIKIGAKAAHEATKQMAISQVFWFGVGEIATGFKSLELLGGAALYAPLPTYAQIGVHAVAGGVYEDLNGGKFIHGFLSAGFSKWYGVGYNFDNPAVQSIERAIVGGVTASLAGGNFGRGAFNAVMAFWFNDSHPLHRETRAQKGQGSNPLSVAGDVLGKIWNIPNTVIGLVYGGVGHVAGWMMGTNPYITFGNNAIQFHNNPLMPSAITLGNVIIYGPSTSPNASNVHFQNTPLNHTVGREEFRHTQQGQILGPLYLPAHALGGISSLFRAPHLGLRHGVDAWHSNNFMETGPMQDRIF